MRFTDEQSLGAMHLVQVLLRSEPPLVHITALGGCPSPVGGHRRRRLMLHCRHVISRETRTTRDRSGRAGGTACRNIAGRYAAYRNQLRARRRARERITFRPANISSGMRARPPCTDILVAAPLDPSRAVPDRPEGLPDRRSADDGLLQAKWARRSVPRAETTMIAE